MKLIDILTIINLKERIIVIHNDKEIYEGENNVYYGCGKYCILMNCYDDKEVRRIALNDSRKAIVIYID